jgi:hypothetical protein
VDRKNRHPHKDIENAVRQAEGQGWVCDKASGHAWGILRCPRNDGGCRNGMYCQISVASTPGNPTNHARKIRRLVEKCVHNDAGKDTK